MESAVKGAQGDHTGAVSPGRFPRTARLRKHAAFERVYREGRRVFSANLTVFFRNRGPAEPGGPACVGFAVGRALGGAVERNRLKRRLREAVRHRLARLNAAVDLVVHPKKSALKAGFPELLAELEQAFLKIQRQSEAEVHR